MIKTEKVYAVTFMRYTNAMRDTVRDDSADWTKSEYLTVGSEAFLVKESELDIYRKFGEGYRTINFVGNIAI